MIWTGYYAKLKNYKSLGFDTVAISGKVPDFYDGLTYPDFAPRWGMFQDWKNGIIDNKGYEKAYVEWLETLDKEEIKKDFELYMNDPKKHVILLCYEKPADFCHRHILAEWLADTFRIQVAEYYVG